jgi:hypothetical protein
MDSGARRSLGFTQLIRRAGRAQGFQPVAGGPAVKGSGVAAGKPVVIVVTTPETAVPAPGTAPPTDDVTGPRGFPDGAGGVDPVPGEDPAGVTRPAGKPAAPGTSLGCCRGIALA